MVEIISGHKNKDCDGRWIDVGTFNNPRDQMCVLCRGHRQKPVEPEQSETTPWTNDDLKIQDDDPEPMPRYSRGMQMLGGAIIAMAIVAAFVLMHMSTQQ